MSQTFATTTVVREARHAAAYVSAPSQLAGDLLGALTGLLGGVSIAIAVPSILETITTPYGYVVAASILAAMAGTFLALVGLGLAARIPVIEREVGQDRLIAWHRKIGPYSVALIGLHVVLVTVGYGLQAGINPVAQLWDMTWNYQWMLAATIGFTLMVGLGLMSWRRIRNLMRYETWHATHVYFYVAIALAFGHQITNGTVFPDNTAAIVYWSALYVAAFAALIGYRVALPVYRSVRHQLRVAAVVPATDDCTHVYMTGRNLEELSARGGQWFTFRFLNSFWRFQGHPYSLSMDPRGDMIRITVKNLGDQSGRLRHLLKTGTRVWFEGPYGAFTRNRMVTGEATLIAGGIGIAPVMSLLGSLPTLMPVTVIYRTRPGDAPLLDELREAAKDRDNTRVVHLDGTRDQYPINAETLTGWAPRITRSDVFVCGGDGFVEAVEAATRDLDMPSDRIHHELFNF